MQAFYHQPHIHPESGLIGPTILATDGRSPTVEGCNMTDLPLQTKESRNASIHDPASMLPL